MRDSALEGMHTFACRACDLQTTTGKDVNAVVRTGRIFCSGASNSSAPSVPPSDKPFSFVATEAQLDGFTSKVTDMALAVPTLHRSLRVPVLSHDNLDYCERGSVSSYKIAGIDNTLHTARI